MNLSKIKYKNFKIWLLDQIKRKVWFRNFFITRNAWGVFSINSHINQHTGKNKVMYNTVETARKSAEKMSEKHGVHFSYYKCLFCDGYHVGKNRDNVLYCEKRLTLPLYYCYRTLAWPYFSTFTKGMYRCEFIDDSSVKVYDTAKGTTITIVEFNLFFKRPSKLKLFLYEHFIWF